MVMPPYHQTDAQRTRSQHFSYKLERSFQLLWSNQNVTACALFFILFLTAWWYRVADNDLFARIAAGGLIVRDRHVPLVDPFAYSPTKPIWIDHEWLSGVIFYLTNQIGGDAGLFILNVLFALCTVYLLVCAQRTMAGPTRSGVALLFFAMFPCSFLWNSVIRSQVITFLCFAIYLLCITKCRTNERSKLYLAAPLVMVLWANCHGGFVVGLGYLGLTCLAFLISKRAGSSLFYLTTITSMLAVLINPYGVQYIEFIRDAVTKSRPLITEWASPALSAQHSILAGFCLLTFCCMLARHRTKLPLEGWLMIVASLYFALNHLRLIPFFLFTCCVYLPLILDGISNGFSTWFQTRVRRFFNTVYFITGSSALVGAMAFLAFPLTLSSFKLDYSQYPVEVMNWLVTNGYHGKLLIHFNEGSYALLKGYPSFQVSIDGRYEEVYPDETFEQALEALNPGSPNFISAFMALRPDVVVLCKSTTPFEVANQFPGSWTAIFVGDRGSCAAFSETKEN